MVGLSLTTVILTPALLWVVVSDLLYRRISNRLVLALLLVWLCRTGWLLSQPGAALTRSDLTTGILTGLAVLVVGYLLFSMRWMGAGDVKLMAVLSLWMGEQALTFLIVSTLAGGVLALAMPLLKRIELLLALGLLRFNIWLPKKRIPTPQSLSAQPVHGIPYGLAIALGAAFVIWVRT